MRQTAYIIIKGKHLSAEIKDGEVVGWQPITLNELNVDIDQCVNYLDNIKNAIGETREEAKENNTPLITPQR